MPMGKMYVAKARLPRKATVKATAKDKQQDRQIRVLKRRVGKPEIKYTDTEIVGPLTVAGSVNYLNGVPQGDQPFDRTGAQIRMTGYSIRGYVFQGNASNQNRLFRIMIIKDKAPRGAVPALFGNTTNGAEAIYDDNAISSIPQLFSPRSREWMDRFQILKDKTYRLIIPDTGISTITPFKITGKLNHLTRYNQTTGAIAACATGAIYFCICTDSVSGIAPNLGVLCRVFYTDD